MATRIKGIKAKPAVSSPAALAKPLGVQQSTAPDYQQFTQQKNRTKDEYDRVFGRTRNRKK